MARVLLAWELGANFGHLAQLVPLAQRLRAHGHEPVFAVPDVAYAEAILGTCGIAYLQAPVRRQTLARTSAAPCSYSEILQYSGYLERDGLLGLVKAWREIYTLVRPDVVLFEHAPTALLASRGFEAARVIYGVGFCSPPREIPFPSFRTWEAIPRERLEESDARVLETVNAVLSKLRLRPLEHLNEILDADDDYLCTFPELDHYGARHGARYCGPVFTRDEGFPAAWPEGGGRRVYVYLRPEMPVFHAVAEALSDSACSVLWVAPGVSEETLRRYATHTLRIVRFPVRLSDAAAQADAAVLYGGHGVVSAMLLAGVPLALFPVHVEQALVARNVARIGAGAVGSPRLSAEDARKAIALALESPRLRERAAAFSARYSKFDPKNVVARIARAVSAHCDKRRGTG